MVDDDDDLEVEEIVEVVGFGFGGLVVVCVNGNLFVEFLVLFDVGIGGIEFEDILVEVMIFGVKGLLDVGSIDGKDFVRMDMVLLFGLVEMGNKFVVGGGGICLEEDFMGIIVLGFVVVGLSGFGGILEL